MKKTFLSLVLGFTFLFSGTNAFAGFVDVSSDNGQSAYTPYAAEIEWLQLYDVVQGYEDGYFRPDNPVSRAEFLKMLYGMLGEKGDLVMKPLDPFKDVDAKEWYYPYIVNAYLDSYVDGYADGTFRPNDSINRAEAFKIVMNAFFVPVYDDLLPAGYDPCFAADGGKLDLAVDSKAWYFEFFEVADDFCVIPKAMIFNSKGELDFDAGQDLTRAEMAAILYRAKAVKDNSSDLFMTKFADGILPKGFAEQATFSKGVVKVGDKIGDMTVNSVDDSGVGFNGEVLISGKYKYGIEDKNQSLAYMVCFYPDSYSLKLIPKEVNSASHGWFCFDDQKLAKERFEPEGSSGRAEITIDNYWYTNYENEGDATVYWDKASLVVKVKIDAEEGFEDVTSGGVSGATDNAEFEYIDPGFVEDI